MMHLLGVGRKDSFIIVYIRNKHGGSEFGMEVI